MLTHKHTHTHWVSPQSPRFFVVDYTSGPLVVGSLCSLSLVLSLVSHPNTVRRFVRVGFSFRRFPPLFFRRFFGFKVASVGFCGNFQ